MGGPVLLLGIEYSPPLQKDKFACKLFSITHRYKQRENNIRVKCVPEELIYLCNCRAHFLKKLLIHKRSLSKNLHKFLGSTHKLIPFVYEKL